MLYLITKQHAAGMLLSSLLLLQGLPSMAQSPDEYTLTVSSRIAKSKEKMYGEWKDYPTRTIATLKNYAPASVPLDSYGGRADKQLAATGFFHAVKEKDRWWIADPAGHAFINIGMVHVSPGSSETMKAALGKVFGNRKNWADKTHEWLLQKGFNATGAWSDVESIKNTGLQRTRPLAYTIIKNFMADYGKRKGGTYQQPGHTGYPDNTIFVFDPEFETFCDEYAQPLAANRNDKNLFGYFSDNELPFERLSLDRYLGKKDTEDNGYKAAHAWLATKQVEPAAITDDIRNEFLGYMAEKYYSVVSKAIKKYDPNHLYLGSRLHFYELKVAPFFKVVGKYVDVIAINYYRVWTPVAADMQNWEAWSGKPFIVTEWYTKGEDSGMPNYSGAGWIVKTQNDRGLFYQDFTLALLESGSCVGFHWFKYQDNDPTDTHADPSNTDANKGVVNNQYKVYEPLVSKMHELNTNIYSLIDFFDKRKQMAAGAMAQSTEKIDTGFHLYLLMGQSNMAGRAPLDDAGRKIDPQIFMLDKNRQWVPATDPVHFDKPGIAGVGPAISFAKAMLGSNRTIKIGLIPCALGGSPIRVWEPDSVYLGTFHPYDDVVARARIGMRQGVLKGILWHQGESDNYPQSAATYPEKFRILIKRLRTDLQLPGLSVVAGEIGYFNKVDVINKVIDALPTRVSHMAVVSAAALTDKGDSVHFDTPSARELGRRYALAMQKLAQIY